MRIWSSVGGRRDGVKDVGGWQRQGQVSGAWAAQLLIGTVGRGTSGICARAFSSRSTSRTTGKRESAESERLTLRRKMCAGDPADPAGACGSGELRELVDGVKKQDEVLERLAAESRRQRRHLPRCVGVLRAERAARGAPVDARLAGPKVQGRADAAALGVGARHESGCERAERARSERLLARRYPSRCAVHGRLCLPVLGVRASAW